MAIRHKNKGVEETGCIISGNTKKKLEKYLFNQTPKQKQKESKDNLNFFKKIILNIK